MKEVERWLREGERWLREGGRWLGEGRKMYLEEGGAFPREAIGREREGGG